MNLKSNIQVLILRNTKRNVQHVKQVKTSLVSNLKKKHSNWKFLKEVNSFYEFSCLHQYIAKC